MRVLDRVAVFVEVEVISLIAFEGPKVDPEEHHNSADERQPKF
jgi:hypothetical protein